MNNNFYDIPVNWYKDFNDTFMSNYNQPSIANSKVALERGNLYNNLYNPYKNYKYRSLVPSNKKEEILYKLLEVKFMLKELDLYLDIHNQDMEMINLYNRYLMEEKKICNEYEKNYGPITLDSEYLNGNNWNWLVNDWPWEGTK